MRFPEIIFAVLICALGAGIFVFLSSSSPVMRSTAGSGSGHDPTSVEWSLYSGGPVNVSVRGIRASVVNASGTTVMEAQVIRLDEVWLRPQRVFLREGTGVLYATESPSKLLVSAPGYLCKIVEAQSEDIEVVLDPSYEVVLSVPDGLEIPPGYHLMGGLKVRSAPYSAVYYDAKRHSARFTGRKARVLPIAGGDAQVRFSVLQSSSGSHAMVPNVPGIIPVIDFGVGPTDRVFDVALTQAQIDDAILRFAPQSLQLSPR